MKKPTSKLQFTHHVVRVLDTNHLAQVQGGTLVLITLGCATTIRRQDSTTTQPVSDGTSSQPVSH